MTHPRRLVVFSGAGLSADIGLSTFRGADGLWENHRIEVVCDGRSWRQNRDLVHRFYNARRASLADVEPNATGAGFGDGPGGRAAEKVRWGLQDDGIRHEVTRPQA